MFRALLFINEINFELNSNQRTVVGFYYFSFKLKSLGKMCEFHSIPTQPNQPPHPLPMIYYFLLMAVIFTNTISIRFLISFSLCERMYICIGNLINHDIHSFAATDWNTDRRRLWNFSILLFFLSFFYCFFLSNIRKWLWFLFSKILIDFYPKGIAIN